MNRTDPVLHRAHAACWYAWGRKDENLGRYHAVDVFEFSDFAAGEAREYHDPNHERNHLGSIQSQWKDFLEDRRIP